ncbi:uncharacterized protein LOC123691115 [Colias croceus]|uniref:uncharacterized protein LOC123691115 n=1 Tax=Colias crocea TaxID=72248 RepID=UPI001E27D3FF|nr:uncharacterized protein LOC123691115 [Colias croceus]
MEWSREKTLRLIGLLQLNAALWNPSLCDTRREKQKRKQELRAIAAVFGISAFDVTKKIQHLRTQYNRELAREAIVHAEDPNDRYVTNWYAYDYLHFLKDSNKPYRVVQSDELSEANSTVQTNNESTLGECKLDNLSPPTKIARTDNHDYKADLLIPDKRDEFSVFGEYIANELRSLKGEKNLLVAKKKIQDVIFEVKMNMFSEPREQPCLYTPGSQAATTSMTTEKIYTTPVISNLSTITSQAPPTSAINEIIISGACHYSTFKVDEQ